MVIFIAKYLFACLRQNCQDSKAMVWVVVIGKMEWIFYRSVKSFFANVVYIWGWGNFTGYFTVSMFFFFFFTPNFICTHHIKVSKRTDDTPEHRSSFDGFDPHGVSEEHTEDSDTLVIIGSSHGTRDVTWHNGNHSSCNQASPSILKKNLPFSTAGKLKHSTLYFKKIQRFLRGRTKSFFWFDTDFTMKAADYEYIVSVIPKEGLAGPRPKSFFWYDNNKPPAISCKLKFKLKIFKEMFWQHPSLNMSKDQTNHDI